MTNFTKIAALALVALTASTTIASALPVLILPPLLKISRPPHNSNHDLECRMRGTDFYVINFGDVSLDSGRQVAWASPETGDSGVITVPVMVAPGDEVRLADLLSIPVAPGTRCNVAFA